MHHDAETGQRGFSVSCLVFLEISTTEKKHYIHGRLHSSKPKSDLSYCQEDEPATTGPLTPRSRFRIRKVLVTGNKRTREDVLRSCLAPITTAKTWEEVQLRTLEANKELQRLGIFKSVRFLLDDAPEAGHPQPGSCDLRVD